MKGEKTKPCHNCGERTYNCHSNCTEYIAFTQAIRDKKDMIRRKKEEEDMMYEVKVRSIRKFQKRDE